MNSENKGQPSIRVGIEKFRQIRNKTAFDQILFLNVLLGNLITFDKTKHASWQSRFTMLPILK